VIEPLSATAIPPSAPGTGFRSAAEILALGALLALGVIVAFDLDYVVVEIEDVEFRPHHVLAGVAIGAASVVVVHRNRATPRNFTRAEAYVIGCAAVGEMGVLLAAYMSPLGSIVHQRTLDLSIVFAVGAATVVVGRRRRVLLLVSIGIGVVFAAFIGVTEFATSWSSPLADRYRGRVTLLGDAVRLTRPFSHANIAAMFFGPAAVGAFAFASAVSGRWRFAILIAGSTLVTITALTASRAGVVAVVMGSLILIAVLAGDQTRRAPIPWIIVSLGAGLLLALLWSPTVRDRVSGPDRFAATVIAPVDLVLEDTETVTVFVRNDSSELWPSAGPMRVVLTARWRDFDQELQWLTQVWPIPASFAPGDSAEVAVQIPVSVPDGAYLLVWDLLLDREAFFLESGGQQSLSRVDVRGSQADLQPGPVVVAKTQPGRVAIWGWAVELIADRPLFGHGVGTMRFASRNVVDGSPVLPSHAHNIVLEPLVGSGLVGSATLLALLGALVVDLGRRIRSVGPVALVVGASLLVILGHGLVEWPLMFTPLATLFAMLGGLWVVSRDDMVIR